ncbi:uncharacterized protein F5891DRAFT_23082 [Suillus fuscotomentosus]|uniref:Uncharacterized protein n=1 Tax=Suillus fuscotomentosus TaxID=1912939 RepID=A0AAD4EM01_9AGAM|nr:uncharacterized protein F5891DRAFT_23082 [Suillus fuscotomentosus]KAG1908647.1 hypothetical protein F5891DRAFT_23082 [Suillus fuscotomentosus]
MGWPDWLTKSASLFHTQLLTLDLTACRPEPTTHVKLWHFVCITSYLQQQLHCKHSTRNDEALLSTDHVAHMTNRKQNNSSTTFTSLQRRFSRLGSEWTVNCFGTQPNRR